MAPRTTIVLNRELSHSIEYDPNDDSVTANLPQPIPIEKTPNKPKLMLLIYFVQRDHERKTSPRKIDAEISMEMRIVEKIVRQFTNLEQAKRSIKEYSDISDEVNINVGLQPNRLDHNGRPRAVKMLITAEIRNTLVEWLKDILSDVCPPRVR